MAAGRAAYVAVATDSAARAGRATSTGCQRHLSSPLRVSELPYIVDAHQSFNEKLGVQQLETGFLSPCKDCHKEAEQGIFDKNRIYQGYGAGMSPY